MQRRHIETSNTENTDMHIMLKDGDDTGDVPKQVKLQVLHDGLGFCAAPGCSNKIVQNRTITGQCAHIIPRKIGSNPREDYKTSPEDRKKESNLLYLCVEHHRPIDNAINAALFSTEILRKWKADHEEWAKGVRKGASFLPADMQASLQALIQNVGNQVSQESQIAHGIVSRLLDTSRDFLRKQLLKEAETLLNEVELLLVDTSNNELAIRYDVLNAQLHHKKEHIVEAKTILLDVIARHPLAVEPMFEYLEYCNAAPEPGDSALQIEALAKEIDPSNVRFTLLELARNCEKRAALAKPITLRRFDSDNYLNSRFIGQHTMFAHINSLLEMKKEFLDAWESALPNSPRPTLFKLMFHCEDNIIRNPNRGKKEVLEALEFTRQQQITLDKKEVMAPRDKIAWKLQELSLSIECVRFTGAEPEQFRNSANELIELICKCYFDRQIDNVLQIILSNIKLGKEFLSAILNQVALSNYQPSPELRELLFLQCIQHAEFEGRLLELLNRYSDVRLLSLFNLIKESKITEIAEFLNSKNDSIYTLIFLQSLPDRKMSARLADLVQVGAEHQESKIFAKLKALESDNSIKDALALLSELELKKADPQTLNYLEQLTYSNRKWPQFISIAEKLINFDIPDEYKFQLYGKLATACFHSKDDSGAEKYAELALNNIPDLSGKNAETMLYVLAESRRVKGLPDAACLAFEKYKEIERSFPLSLQEAESYIRSSKPTKFEQALSIIIEAFQKREAIDDNIYAAAYLLLIEIGNGKGFVIQNESVVADGLFVKIDGLNDGWFYLGDSKNAMGATAITADSANYDAVIGKIMNEDIEWPADKFSQPGYKRKIIHILTPAAYLNQRGHEAMDNLGKLGTKKVWTVKVLNDDGTLDKENLKRFSEEIERPGNEFFESYKTTNPPFAFLCKMEGGIARAVGRINSESAGFIRCNNGTQADITNQENNAERALNGEPFFIDSLAALMLAESESLAQVITALPNLHVPVSVIRVIRKMADEVSSSTSVVGRGSFKGGNFNYQPKDDEKEALFRTKLLNGAALLDSLPNRLVGEARSEDEDELESHKIDKIVPDHFLHPFRLAQSKECLLLTDDAVLIEAFRITENNFIPPSFSSISLIRKMAQKGLISVLDHLKFFSLLSGYRYHLLQISVDDLLAAVLPKSKSGLVSFEPKNLLYLNLGLTLSADYGVNDQVAASILSQFFNKVVSDDSITTEMADQIFANTLVTAFSRRDVKVIGRVILAVCKQRLPADNWTSNAQKQKVNVLELQIRRLAQGFDPIVQSVPQLLRVTEDPIV